MRNWPQLVVFGLVALLVFVLGVMFLTAMGCCGVSRPGSMMGPWAMGSGMMSGGFGWGWMGLQMLLPILLVALVVLAAVAVGHAIGRSGGAGTTPVARRCSNCGRDVQVDWRVCPHCGSGLTGQPSPAAPADDPRP